MCPSTFNAALSQQVSHAAQLLSLVLHPRFPHLAHMGLWLGPFSWDTARSLLAALMTCARHLAVCTDQQIAFTPCHKQDIPQVTIKNHGAWEGLLCSEVSVLHGCCTPSPLQCLCAGLACAVSCDQTLPHAGWHLPSFPSGETAGVSVCVHASFDYLWVSMHVRPKKCIFTKSSRKMMGCEWLCEFVLPEFAPEKVLFHTKIYWKLTVQIKWYLLESLAGDWGTCTQDHTYGLIASTERK